MKCPHCNKNIRIKKEKPYDHPIFGDGFMSMFIFNFMLYTVPFAWILDWLDNNTSLPLSIEDGLSVNFGVMMIIPIAIFVLTYVGLYRYKKVKGRLLMKLMK